MCEMTCGISHMPIHASMLCEYKLRFEYELHKHNLSITLHIVTHDEIYLKAWNNVAEILRMSRNRKA
jgi:hypothetical protein